MLQRLKNCCFIVLMFSLCYCSKNQSSDEIVTEVETTSEEAETTEEEKVSEKEITPKDEPEQSQKKIIDNMPTGIYVLSPGNSTRNIRDYDFVSGYSLRFNWADFEIKEGVYDFSVIDQCISQLQDIDQKLTLELLVFKTPKHVLENSEENWSFFGENPVPWDRYSLEAYKKAVLALANHKVANSEGILIPLSEHPTVVTVDAPIMGLSGIRDLSNKLVSLDSYQREKFVQSALESVGAMRNAFPKKHGFLAIFGMSDKNTSAPLDTYLIDRLMEIYNKPNQPTLGFFQELLSDVGPIPQQGPGKLLNYVSSQTYTLFQALTSWKSPFTGANKVTSGTPIKGLELGFKNFGTRYYELYVTDIDNQNIWDEYRIWKDKLIHN